MKTSSTTAIIMAASALASCVGSVSAQSNVRDFGPPTYGRGFAAAPSYPVAPTCAANSFSANPSPYTQVGFQPIVGQTPIARPGCGHSAANNAYRPYGNNPYAYGAYSAGYAPYANANTAYWSSTTPRQYSGNTLFGTQTVYGKDEPVRNLFRFLVP